MRWARASATDGARGEPASPDFPESRVSGAETPFSPPLEPCREQAKIAFFRIFPRFFPCFPVEKWPTLFLIIAIRTAD
jgi:hypothetical protein